MARKQKRPERVVVGEIKVRAIRGPAKDNPCSWYWRAERRLDGQTHTLWTGWGTRDEVSARVLDLAARGALDPDADPDEWPEELRTVGELLKLWHQEQKSRADLSRFTRRNRRVRVANVRERIGDVLLSRLDRRVLERYRNTRIREHAAPSTVQDELKTLRAAWSWGREVGATPDRALPRVKLSLRPVRPRYTPTRGEIGAVVEQLSGWPRLAVLLLVGTGARIREIARLRWQDVDLSRAVLVVNGKTGAREVPIGAELVEALRAWGPGEGSILGVTENTACAQIGTRWLRSACEAAGVPRFTAQGLRRAAADEYQRAGVDIGTAAALLGHSPQVMLRYYRQASPRDKREAVERVRLDRLPRGEVVEFKARE